MAMNKKAMFFTLIAVVLVVAIIAFFMPSYDTFSYMSQVPTLKTRFVKANTFATSMYGDIGERALAQASFSALKSMNAYIFLTHKPLSNVSSNFTTVMMNGTLGGVTLKSLGINYMENNSISERLQQFSLMADKELGIKANMSVTDVRIYQSTATSYDTVAVMMNLTMALDSGIASWNSSDTVITYLAINRFDDPYYILNNNTYNRIYFSNLTNFTTISEVFYHIDAMKYTYEGNAPSFLMRFENKSGNSTCCGIESLINPYRLNVSVEVPVSYVDYCFFGQPQVESCGYPSYTRHNFTHISNATVGRKFYGFRLEPYHYKKYNLTYDIDS